MAEVAFAVADALVLVWDAAVVATAQGFAERAVGGDYAVAAETAVAVVAAVVVVAHTGHVLVVGGALGGALEVACCAVAVEALIGVLGVVAVEWDR